ncbi:DUF2169 family type VI secretion system accessory protein [Massilia glaciei]|uniref:DUF2169 family type VI secretion system accessory protein n=1 Tax=Massilia glaciei TaxID=1524097 RepID=UPI0015E818D9|nr:DUF2169 domain-containing protein [Massilia glaciei]
MPNLLFDNRTPFSAAQFDTVDQHDGAFHVFVAKIGYTIGPCDQDGWATLKVLDTPAELNTQDRHHGDDPSASVLEESDFAPYKPRCDVIVNAVAHVPDKKPAKELLVRLAVMPSLAGEPAPPAIIDKTLMVCGERWFVRKTAVTRLLHWPVKIGTLGLLRPNPWRLSAAAPMTSVPVRYELALGGECRIDSDDRASKRVPAKHRIGPATPAEPCAIAHEACETNPLGKGFTRKWYLKAAGKSRLPAPQVGAAFQLCNAKSFSKGARGGKLEEPSGFGVIGRAWQPRRALIGKIEEKKDWEADEVPRLPVDFDFGYWNCAPRDQQCAYLAGGERFSLVNLCSPDSPSARKNQSGNTVLRFALPQQAVFVLAVNLAEELTVMPLSLDTVVVNPESNRLDLVWRGFLRADGNNVSSRLMHITQADQLARLDELVRHQWSEAEADDSKGE